MGAEYTNSSSGCYFNSIMWLQGSTHVDSEREARRQVLVSYLLLGWNIWETKRTVGGLLG